MVPRMARFTILKRFILLVAVKVLKNFTSCQLWCCSVLNCNAFIPYLSASDFIFTRRVTFHGSLPVVSPSIRCIISYVALYFIHKSLSMQECAKTTVGLQLGYSRVKAWFMCIWYTPHHFCMHEDLCVVAIIPNAMTDHSLQKL